MAYFAVVENGFVVNTIIADDLQTAESLVGADCIEYTLENPAIIGLRYIDGVFEQVPILIFHEDCPDCDAHQLEQQNAMNDELAQENSIVESEMSIESSSSE